MDNNFCRGHDLVDDRLEVFFDVVDVALLRGSYIEDHAEFEYSHFCLCLLPEGEFCQSVRVNATGLDQRQKWTSQTGVIPGANGPIFYTYLTC